MDESEPIIRIKGIDDADLRVKEIRNLSNVREGFRENIIVCLDIKDFLSGTSTHPTSSRFDEPSGGPFSFEPGGYTDGVFPTSADESSSVAGAVEEVVAVIERIQARPNPASDEIAWSPPPIVVYNSSTQELSIDQGDSLVEAGAILLEQDTESNQPITEESIEEIVLHQLKIGQERILSWASLLNNEEQYRAVALQAVNDLDRLREEHPEEYEKALQFHRALREYQGRVFEINADQLRAMLEQAQSEDTARESD
jgi:hypothetical protein